RRGVMASMRRDRRVTRVRLRPEALEGRALPSVAASAANLGIDQIITAIYEHELHRDPAARELRLRERQLEAGARPIGLAARLLASTAYRAAPHGAIAFVEGLYRDVLGHAPDPAGEQFWVEALSRGKIGPEKMAETFLAAPGSFLGVQGGGITSVAATNGWSS